MIEKVEIKDFKRFTNLTLNLSGRSAKVVGLVGKNGSGKSAVFDAMKHFMDYKYGKGLYERKFDDKNEFVRSLGVVARGEKVNIVLEGGKDIKDLNVYFRSSYRYIPSLQTNEIRALPQMHLDQDAPANTAKLDSRMNTNHKRLLGKFIDEVYDQETSGRQWVENNVREINISLKKVLDIELTHPGNVQDGRTSMYFKKGLSTNIPFDTLSAGEKEVVDLILDIHLKKSILKNTIVCIDEPELHINSSVQKELLKELERLLPGSSQLWIATHSIGMIRVLCNELKDKSIIFNFSNINFDETQELNPVEISRNSLNEIFEVALDDLATLLAPKQIIYCESTAEPDQNGNEQGLDARVYNQIFNEEFKDTIFVSSGGNNEPRINSEIAIKVLQKAFIGTEILYLKDRGGKESYLTDKQREQQLIDNSNKRILSRRELENYIFDPEILERFNPSFNKTKVDFEKNKYLKPHYQLIKQAVNYSGENNQLMFELSKYISKETEVYKELKKDIFGD